MGASFLVLIFGAIYIPLQFVNTLLSFNFLPVIHKATRFPPLDLSEPTLIDQIWYNTLTPYDCGIVNFDTRDHLPIYIQLPLVEQLPEDRSLIKVSFRTHDSLSKYRFYTLLNNFDWKSLKSTDPC